MMPSNALEILRQVNENLRSALVRLHPEQKHCSSIRPQDFSDIMSQILRAAECLRRSPAHSEADAALEKEIREYRSNLEEIKDFLPDLHGRLLAEKTRLETAQNHVAATAAWARASKKTL
jgi:hypothetical protein